jgi:DNA-binding transcriptional LysR family regulator
VANGAGLAFVDNFTAADARPGALQHRRLTEIQSLKTFAVWNSNRPLPALGTKLVAAVTQMLKRYRE